MRNKPDILVWRYSGMPQALKGPWKWGSVDRLMIVDHLDQQKKNIRVQLLPLKADLGRFTRRRLLT